jgi:predicted Na+-dependent transporter
MGYLQILSILMKKLIFHLLAKVYSKNSGKRVQGKAMLKIKLQLLSPRVLQNHQRRSLQGNASSNKKIISNLSTWSIMQI